MKEAKSEAEKIIANYRAEMEATYQVALAKVHTNYITALWSPLLFWPATSPHYFINVLIVFSFSLCILRATAPAARRAVNWRHPPTAASKTCSKLCIPFVSSIPIFRN